MLAISIVALSALAALLVPAVFVITRVSTKHNRRNVVKDLGRVFDRSAHGADDIIPSFEFVKYKYSAVSHPLESDDRHEFKAWHWFVGALPLTMVTFTLDLFSATAFAHAAFRLPITVGIAWLDGDRPLPLFAWVVLAAYGGAMLFTLRAFNQAINNFDLSPLSFIGATVNILFGVGSGLLFVFGVLRLTEAAPLWDVTSPKSFPIILLTAFASGYFPDVVVRNIVRLSQLRHYKKEDNEVYKSFKAIPIEVIDGIDLEIRARLADFHINSVQNLAAANPLMLFVETPYGVYQIMDWVAQAQLCASVGPKALTKLWGLGIRTIFDLERVALDPLCYDPVLLAEIGGIIWATQHRDERGQSVTLSQGAIAADIRFRLENPHVHRLRQIFNRVGESLGSEARRLPPVIDCDEGSLRGCPFRMRAASL